MSGAPGPKVGLILTGGGARSAYQVGVLKAIAELLPRGARCPFPVITGTSAGAVSAIALASDAAHFRRAVEAIERVWRQFRVHHVFKADPVSLLRSGLHWMLALFTGGWLVHPPHALFDCAPLWKLLGKELRFDGIPRSIYKGHLEAIGICSTSYYDAHSVTFFAGAAGVEPWRRAMRKGERVQLTLPHLMASLAIPFMFRPISLGGEYYGDGAMRQTSPLSPAFHLGADRLLVIGVGASDFVPAAANSAVEPSFGHMFGFMLDSLFLDQINTDLEIINTYNQGAGTRQVQALIMMPSEEVGAIARRHARELPRSLRVLMRTVGASDTGGTHLLSYLLFERGFTRELIALGYRDATARAGELLEFLGLDAVARQRVRGARR